MGREADVFLLQAELCGAMSHPVRLRIVHALKEAPRRTTDIAAALGLAPSTVSRHLARLRSAGVVTLERQGHASTSRIADPRILEVCTTMRKVLRGREGRRVEVLNRLGG